MKLSLSVNASDLISVPQMPIEKVFDLFDRKSNFFQKRPLADTISSLKNVGVDGFELLIPHFVNKNHIKELEEILTIQRMRVFSIHQPLSNPSGLSLKRIEELCEIAKAFSSYVIVLHSTTLGKNLLDAGFTNSLKKLEKEYSITFGIENMTKNIVSKMPFTYDSGEFAKAVSEAGLHITFDTTHLGQVGDDILKFYSQNKDSIVNIHMSDYRRTFINRFFISQFSSHLPLCEGELPIKKLLTMLKKDTYSGLLTMEVNSGLDEVLESGRIIRCRKNNV